MVIQLQSLISNSFCLLPFAFYLLLYASLL
jgi:hypothetical protein